MHRILGLTMLLLSSASNHGVAAGKSENQANQQEASSEKTFTIKLDASPPTIYCKSNTSIEYFQNDTTANVSGEIKIDGCTDASGQYTISIRYRDGAGETHNLDFDETWQRSSVAPVVISHVYPMAENVDLIRVRARRSRCVCDEPDDDTDQNQEESPPIEPRKEP